MNKFKYILMVLVGCLCMACEKEVGNPSFAPDELYVYDQTASTLAAVVGEEFAINLIVSPNDGSVECKWTLDGKVIGSSKDLLYTFTTPGTFALRFDATRGGRTLTINYALTVTK